LTQRLIVLRHDTDVGKTVVEALPLASTEASRRPEPLAVRAVFEAHCTGFQ